MENIRKRGRGQHGPSKYFTEKERVDAIRKSKTKYMVNKEWYCYVCNNDVNYKLAGKHRHLGTNKHLNNVDAINTRKIN